MPFPFALPTTSYVAFTEYFSSSTHPSLPLAATSARAVLRDELKEHKRLTPQSQTANLGNILAALNEYIPYLFTLDAGLSGTVISGEEIDVVLQRELEVEWRPTLAARIPGRESSRVKLKSLETEICFAVSTLGYVYSLLARSQLLLLYSSATTPTPSERTALIVSAMKYYLDANSAQTYLVNRAGQWNSLPAVPDLSQPVLSGLASLTLAEATLITVFKDDPYPAAVAQERNKNDKEWMFKNPDISSVRAHLFARLCLAAAEHASKARALIGKTNHIDQDLVKYLDNLRRTARSKACRFFAIDADLAGKLGEGIAWLRAARKELGYEGASHNANPEESRFKGLAKLKRDIAEKREDKKIEKAGDWGTDGGRLEEGRVIDMLEKKWVKMNDTVLSKTALVLCGIC